MKTLEILQAVAGGKRSAREMCEAALARIESSDAGINAFTDRTVARARAGVTAAAR
jgi:amidase/aspartyl-tRNA(Asn)/glutamyl-tRNA(Gln) amidotransferase subunit A